MTVSLIANAAANFSGLGAGALEKKLQADGRLPSVSLLISPLTSSPFGNLGLGRIVLDRFLNYSFKSSIMVPVDTFNFSFVAPDGPSMNEAIKDGDLVQLSCNDIPIATGIIDTTTVEVDHEFGEKGEVVGRDLMGQLEDQDAISLDSSPIWATNVTVVNGVQKLLDNTRMTKITPRSTPAAAYLLATEPSETKLSALQRFLEPLNCLAWCGPDGSLIVGKPNMAQRSSGRLVLNKEKRFSNVLSMKVTRSATSIANVIVPIWSGQETTVNRVSKEQAMMNKAKRPAELFKLGHRVPKTVVVSAPNATDPQGLAGINALTVGGANLLQAYAKRELARQNFQEMLVQAVVPGHCNDSGAPYMIDTVYSIEYDRGGVFENMYLYQLEYKLDESGGQRTVLEFCRLGSIVSDVRAP